MFFWHQNVLLFCFFSNFPEEIFKGSVKLQMPHRGGALHKHGGTPSLHDTFLTLRVISPPCVVRGCFVGGSRWVYRNVSRLPSSSAERISGTVTGAMPGKAMGRLSTTKCTYVPTYHLKRETMNIAGCLEHIARPTI